MSIVIALVAAGQNKIYQREETWLTESLVVKK